MIRFIQKFFKKQKTKIMSYNKGSIGSIKLGDKIIPVKNTNGHNYTIGKTYIVCENHSTDPHDRIRAKDPITGEHGNILFTSDVQKLNITRDDFKVDELWLETELADTRTKLQWMDEVGTDTFDETEYKTWAVMTALDNTSMSKIERVKLIASLING